MRQLALGRFLLLERRLPLRVRRLGVRLQLMARGCQPYDAARIAVLWLTEAGDALWAERGPGWDALDLIAELPATLRRLFAAAGLPWPPLG